MWKRNNEEWEEMKRGKEEKEGEAMRRRKEEEDGDYKWGGGN